MEEEKRLYAPLENMDNSDTVNITGVFNHRAVFSDGTGDYRIPAEPNAGEPVRIRIRTARGNATSVILATNRLGRFKMNRVQADELFDYYETELVCPCEILNYYFIIWCGDSYHFYNQSGCSEEVRYEYDFRIMPGFKTPDWAKGAVMYQIYTDRFCCGSTQNTVLSDEYEYIGGHTVRVTDWFKYPAVDGVREFYGGDLVGVRSKLDYLQKLGVEVIYFNPLFVSPSNHKYDAQDYDYIDPHFTVIPFDEGALLEPGDRYNSHAERYINRVTDLRNLEASNAYFADFIREVHERGMKVILDGVFNHCGSFNKWMDRQCIYEKNPDYPPGAYVSDDSPYRSFFAFRDEKQWPYNGSYDGWWGHDTLPKLNYEESPELFDYIMRIARKWVSEPFNADGWRLDVAADLGHSPEYNHYFWQEFRKNVREANPNAIILAENYGNSEAWLQGREWDTVMNYDAFMEPVTWFLTGMQKHSDERRDDLCNNPDAFFGAMTYHMARMNTQSLLTAMNELSNHDHSRFLTRTNKKVGRTASLGAEAANQDVRTDIMREAVVMQMTWPGAPTVYYGDEAGVCGWTDPDNRRTYPWGREDTHLLEFHRQMIHIHKSYEALKTGSLKYLAASHGMLAYGRFNADERLVIAINNNDDFSDIDIPVWETGSPQGEQMVRLIHTHSEGYDLSAETYRAENGVIRMRMHPHSAIVLKNLTWRY